jgi:PAS domain S-box-containing protein
MLCSILLLDLDGVHIRHCAAPSLPAEYLKAIDGAAIGPVAGSCGTAAYRREPVFVADIESDPLWTDYRELALPHGVRACWSTPIFDAQRNVLGTFAIYYRHVGLPDERHQKLISMATDTAAVCIAKHRADEALRESEEQFRAVVEFSPECIAVAVQDHVVYLNPAAARLIGAEDPAKVIGRSVYDFSPVEIHELMKERRRAVLASGIAATPMVAPMVRLDGTSIIVEAIAVPFVYRGQPAILNLIRDITERKQAEESLRAAQERELHARQEFARQLLTAQERERKRLASELHDSLGQNLSIVKNRLHFARQIPSTPDAVLAHLDAIERVAADAIGETRNLARNLRPLHIEQVGLTDSLKGLIQEVSQSTDIRFERRVEQLDDVMRGEAATHIYRIVQEALNNLVKHSRATTAGITIERDVRSVRLRIEDDGAGFDTRQRSTNGGLGLTSLDERARMLGGAMLIESAPGKGTRLEFQIPITETGDEPVPDTIPT